MAVDFTVKRRDLDHAWQENLTDLRYQQGWKGQGRYDNPLYRLSARQLYRKNGKRNGIPAAYDDVNRLPNGKAKYGIDSPSQNGSLWAVLRDVTYDKALQESMTGHKVCWSKKPIGERWFRMVPVEKVTSFWTLKEK